MIKRITGVGLGNIGAIEMDFTGPIDKYSNKVKDCNMLPVYAIYNHVNAVEKEEITVLAAFFILMVIADPKDKLEKLCELFVEDDDYISLQVEYFTHSEDKNIQERKYSLVLTKDGIQEEVLDDVVFAKEDYKENPFKSKLDILSKYTFEDISIITIPQDNYYDHFKEVFQSVCKSTTVKMLIIDEIFKNFKDLSNIKDFEMSEIQGEDFVRIYYNDGHTEELNLNDEETVRFILLSALSNAAICLAVKKYTTLVFSELTLNYLSVEDIENLIVGIYRISNIGNIQVIFEFGKDLEEPIVGISGAKILNFDDNYILRPLI